MAAAAATGVAAGLVAPLAGASVGVQYATACTALAAAIVLAIWSETRRSGDVISVLALVGVFYFLAFVAGSVYLWLDPAVAAGSGLPTPFSHHGLMRAEWLCLLTWTGFTIGYRARLFAVLRIPHLRLRTASARTYDRALITLYGIGYVARLVELSRGLFFHNLSSSATVNRNGTVPISSSTNQLLADLGLLPLMSVAYLGIRSCSNSRLRRYYWPALALETLVAALSGGRGEVISVIIVALGVEYYGRGRFPIRATLVAALVGMFFVFPVLALYRGNSVSSGYQASNLSLGITQYTSGSLGSTLLSGVTATLKRFIDITAPAALEDRGRNAYPVGFAGTLPTDIGNLVPHALDPGKTAIDALQNKIGYALRLSNVKNSYFALTMDAEMYTDFGTAGAALAFIIIGSIYRELNDWLGERRTSPAIGGFYLALGLTILSSQETFMGDQLFGLLRAVIVVTVAIKAVIFLVSPRTEPAAAGRVAT